MTYNQRTEADVLQHVLEIVDMFADENLNMAHDELLKRSTLRKQGDKWTVVAMTDDGIIHTVMFRTARMIGDAIRTGAINEDHDVLKRALDTAGMFEDENRCMATDTIFAMRRASDSEQLYTIAARGTIHTAMFHSARMIGDAIRAKFGLPAKED